MALLSFVDSTPRAYRLKAGNAARRISTDAGTSPVTTSTTMPSGQFSHNQRYLGILDNTFRFHTIGNRSSHMPCNARCFRF